MEKESLKPILESLIFASENALTLGHMVSILEGAERGTIRLALDELIEEYRVRAGGVSIEEVAGGYQFRTNPENAPWVRRLFKTTGKRMSRASMETLSIIAYKQPVTRGELEAVRGVDSGGVLSTLLEKRLIKITGRKETPGRPVVYGTTKGFLEAFDLKDLACLPTLKEIQALEEEDAPQEEPADTPEDKIEEHGTASLEDGRIEDVEPPGSYGPEEGAEEGPEAPEGAETSETPESTEATEAPEAAGEARSEDCSGEAPEGDSPGRDNIETQGRRDDPRGQGDGEPEGGLDHGGQG